MTVGARRGRLSELYGGSLLVHPPARGVLPLLLPSQPTLVLNSRTNNKPKLTGSFPPPSSPSSPKLSTTTLSQSLFSLPLFRAPVPTAPPFTVPIDVPVNCAWAGADGEDEEEDPPGAESRVGQFVGVDLTSFSSIYLLLLALATPYRIGTGQWECDKAEGG